MGVALDPAFPRVSHVLARSTNLSCCEVPEWVRHADGARHIAAVAYFAATPDPIIHRLGQMFGEGAETASGWEVRTDQVIFRVMNPGRWHVAIPGAGMPVRTPGEPGGVAIDVAVTKLNLEHVLFGLNRGIPARRFF